MKIISERKFEWDNIKSMLNEVKHGVTFENAAKVFDDEYRIVQPDLKHSQSENRYQVIGMVNDVLMVVCTERIDVIRIISARHATDIERRIYYGND